MATKSNTERRAIEKAFRQHAAEDKRLFEIMEERRLISQIVEILPVKRSHAQSLVEISRSLPEQRDNGGPWGNVRLLGRIKRMVRLGLVHRVKCRDSSRKYSLYYRADLPEAELKRILDQPERLCSGGYRKKGPGDDHLRVIQFTVDSELLTQFRIMSRVLYAENPNLRPHAMLTMALRSAMTEFLEVV